MCNNCYHSIGRNKKAWKCIHTDKPLYALGVCQNCYQTKYSSKAKKTIENDNDDFSSLILEEKKEKKIFSQLENTIKNENINKENVSNSFTEISVNIDNNIEISQKEKF